MLRNGFPLFCVCSAMQRRVWGKTLKVSSHSCITVSSVSRSLKKVALWRSLKCPLFSPESKGEFYCSYELAFFPRRNFDVRVEKPRLKNVQKIPISLKPSRFRSICPFVKFQLLLPFILSCD